MLLLSVTYDLYSPLIQIHSQIDLHEGLQLKELFFNFICRNSSTIGKIYIHKISKNYKNDLEEIFPEICDVLTNMFALFIY